jgi:VanZ family protein
MTSISNLTRYWLPLIAYALAIFVQSQFPAPQSLPQWSGSDKLLHGLAYAVMGALFYRAYRTLDIGRNPRRALVLAILSTALYGLSDEVHQYFVPTRQADILDFLADAAGGAAGAALFRRFIDAGGRRGGEFPD